MTKSLSLMTMTMNFLFLFLHSLSLFFFFLFFSVVVLQYLESEWLSGYTSYLNSHVAETDLFVSLWIFSKTSYIIGSPYLKSRSSNHIIPILGHVVDHLQSKLG